MTIFIAFGHRKRVGKDTAAKFLCSFLRIQKKGSDIRIVGWSDKGKDICSDIYGWAGLKPAFYYEQPNHEKEKDEILPLLEKSPRQIWIEFLSGVCRKIYDATWVDYLINNLKCDVAIIKDLRFPIECDKIRSKGGKVHKIERPNIKHIPDEADDPLENYSGWDSIIVNDGSLADFNKKIVNLGEELII